MPTNQPLRSILKNPPTSKLANELAQESTSKEASSKSALHRQTALHHASQLQAQKDHSLFILSAVEQLLDLPGAPKASPSHPSSEDKALFLRLVSSFQPSEYDALIEERNISGICGYVLCARAPSRDHNRGAKLRIVAGARKKEALKVVNAKELEKWCSDDCAKRDMWVRLQLDEEPGWMRPKGSGTSISLYPEGHDANHQKEDGDLADLAKRTGGLRLHAGIEEEERQCLDRAATLAVERGEKATPPDAMQQQGLVDVQVREKTSTGRAEPPSMASTGSEESNAHRIVEGFNSQFGANGNSGKNDDDHDDWL